jgi:Zn-dependent protease with chaperone function
VRAFLLAAACQPSIFLVTMNNDISTSAQAPFEPMATAPGPVQPVHVIPYRHEEPLFWISVYFAISLWLVMLLLSFGLIIPIMLLIGLLGLFAHSLLIAWLKGNSVKVTAQQFPDLHALYMQTCTRLGIDNRPELYLAQADGMLNAMATRFMRRDYVVLLSAVVDALEDRPQAIKFYMGHELGHIKRKHLSRHWWLWPGMLYPLISPAYSRAREYTCDRYGFASCDNLEDAKRALAVLVAGPERWKKLDLNAFEAQSQETGGFWMAVNELTADYPWLCKRMMVLENRNAVFPKRSFFAWMIALLSPRMGYGGAIIGFLYWLMLGILILVLAATLAFSSSGMSLPSPSANNPIIKLWQKIMGMEESEELGMGDGVTSSDAASATTSADDESLIAAFSQLNSLSSAVDEHMLANKNRAPKSLDLFDKDKEIDTSGVDYQLLGKADSKRLPNVQLVLEKMMQCETCGAAESKIQFRKDLSGNWTCHIAGIPSEMMERQSLECEAIASE